MTDFTLGLIAALYVCSCAIFVAVGFKRGLERRRERRSFHRGLERLERRAS